MSANDEEEILVGELERQQKKRRLPISPRAAVLSLRRESILWRRLFEDKDGDFSGSKALCRDLELSFRKVWLRLYTSGADENYSMALKEFVKATVMAFDRGYSIQALIFELGRHEMETGDPNIDKTIRLTEQERDVREHSRVTYKVPQVWLTLIYLTLHRLQYKSKSGESPPLPEDTRALQALVQNTCNALEAGFTLEGLKLELSLRKSQENQETMTPVQVSVDKNHILDQ
ncbi:hypothetical protein GUITHDRAFT_139457 [Guillardia theta CCMP2712]|uniref:Uncharacterized protein n=1 Tax=Guillardia theta (strain CCMP2712) TaxID=905079 RepID=L1J9R2_GUITC|nr:hypothetical protein GUITHDRAFT_139457 [Guillardia theta CCMP2712]EKX44834.1 hypothetical protein GUITHDRAFT_139457 [Guillardia theta CCMP2712]|eukprot:XP_005831814.1 hypothetical protein GUITHDRAFT_139457 [Guillardia theta CCMP2712]